MDSLLKLSPASGAPVRILQITDTHLFAGKHETLLGVNTWASYEAVLDAIQSQSTYCDLIIATGDLAQDHSAEAYLHFVEGIQRLSAPCAWLPGNHDFQPAMYTTLAAAKVEQAKQVLLGDSWQLVLLDTQVYGVPYGELGDYQLNWLEKTLASYPQRHTLVLLHHHPVLSGCDWLDQHNLRNASRLDVVLRDFPFANTLVCGHIHQALDVEWNGRRVLATPSTCVQFKPYCTHFTIDNLPPGWRWLELYPDGRIETDIERLTTGAFVPDPDSEGY